LDEDSLRYEGWRVAGASAAGVFLASATFYVFAVFLKPLCEEFGWSRQSVSSAYGVAAASAALSAPLLGYLFDRVAAKRIVVPGFALSGCALASLSLLTPRLAHLYAVFAVLGVAAGGTSALAYSRLISSWFDRRRGVALALMMCGGALGGILLPPAAQALIPVSGWRGAYRILGVLVIVVALPIMGRYLNERRSAEPGAGSAPAGASLREALRSRVFWILLVVVFASTLASHGAIVHLSALLTDRGVPASRAALAVSALGGASLAGRFLTGLLLDRFLAARVALALVAIAALGALTLASARSLGMGVLAAALIGFGTGGELDVTPYLLSRYFGLRSVTTLYGLTWTALGAAGAVGPVLLGRAFDATGSYESALVGLAVGMLGAGLLLLALPAYDSVGAARAS
jgi:predicted MFS family arabinose efflux permease